MKNSRVSVGDIVDARCTKCRKITNHVIVAMVASKPANVRCNTCDGTHRYRQPAATSKMTKRTSDSLTVKQEEWAELQTAMSGETAREYDMEKEYRVGIVIRHASFGLGLVQRIRGNRKMEVLFASGPKTMRCK